MIKHRILEICENLKNDLGLTNFYYYDDLEDDGYLGINDKELNYGYIRLQNVSRATQFKIIENGRDYGCQDLSVEGRYRVVVDIELTYDKNVALGKLVFALVANGFSVTGAGFIAESTYSEETNSNLSQRKNIITADVFFKDLISSPETLCITE